jgi:site-specific recombinase XerD
MDLSSFKNYLLLNGASQESAKTFCAKVKSFFKQHEAFNQETLNSFLASKVEKWCGNSFNINRNAFNHYAKFLKLDIDIPKYHKTEKRIKDYLTDKDYSEIVSKIPMIFDNPDKAKAVFILLFSTGLRPKEVINLKRENFNFDEKVVTIKNTKVHRDKTAILSDELCEMLPAIFNQEMEQTNAFNLTKDKLDYIFDKINEVMGLKIKLTPYSMRHGFAHDMIKKGLDLNSLKVMMGHSSINTTLGYLDVSEKEAQDKTRKLINKRRK